MTIYVNIFKNKSVAVVERRSNYRQYSRIFLKRELKGVKENRIEEKSLKEYSLKPNMETRLK